MEETNQNSRPDVAHELALKIWNELAEVKARNETLEAAFSELFSGGFLFPSRKPLPVMEPNLYQIWKERFSVEPMQDYRRIPSFRWTYPTAAAMRERIEFLRTVTGGDIASKSESVSEENRIEAMVKKAQDELIEAKVKEENQAVVNSVAQPWFSVAEAFAATVNSGVRLVAFVSGRRADIYTFESVTLSVPGPEKPAFAPGDLRFVGLRFQAAFTARGSARIIESSEDYAFIGAAAFRVVYHGDFEKAASDRECSVYPADDIQVPKLVKDAFKLRGVNLDEPTEAQAAEAIVKSPWRDIAMKFAKAEEELKLMVELFQDVATVYEYRFASLYVSGPDDVSARAELWLKGIQVSATLYHGDYRPHFGTRFLWIGGTMYRICGARKESDGYQVYELELFEDLTLPPSVVTILKNAGVEIADQGNSDDEK